MTSSLKEVLRKLTDEKFGGDTPEWRDAKWGDIEVSCAQDDGNWYYRHGNYVYVQSKGKDKTPHCYECDSRIEFKVQTNSIHFTEFDGPVGGGEVRMHKVPYCPTCEREPASSGILRSEPTF